MSKPPAGWFADPLEPKTERFWDGDRFTDATRPVAAPRMPPPAAPRSRPRSRAASLPLWIIAICLLAIVIGGGYYLYDQHRADAHHAKAVAAETKLRMKYKLQAQFFCVSAENIDPSAATMSTGAYMHSQVYKACVKDEIDSLISEAKNN